MRRGLHFAFMEFHRGRVNQKFEGVYKRGDGERNETERDETETEERSACVSLSESLTHHLRRDTVAGVREGESRMAIMM